jgi:AcrR family transcriptional regulator
MSPQRSNRDDLLEGALRCLERLPPERITARAIAAESRANPASIAYHFGSKDNLVTEAAITGLDRWLEEIAESLGDVAAVDPAIRYRRAGEAMERTRRRHAGLARTFLAALAMAQHDERVCELISDGFARTRPSVARLLGLGGDRVGDDAAGLVLSLFYGLLFQTLLDPDLAIEGKRLQRAQARLRVLLPESA